MKFHKDNYAFNECSILKLCEIQIRPAYRAFFDKSTLTAKNYSKLKTGIQKLDKHNIPKFRFVPSEIESNIIKVANQILEGYNIQILGRVFKTEVSDQLKSFHAYIKKDFKEINKDDDIDEIKEIFKNNERKLKREKNIPEDDDFKIIAGYCKHSCVGKKCFISEDEHFWEYDDLILTNFSIHIVKEWECHLIPIP